MKKLLVSMLALCMMQASAVKAGNTDISNLNNVIYVQSALVTAGSTTQLSICMKNEAAIRGFQFNLYLPDGMTASVNSKGRIVSSLSSQRLDADDEHTLTLSQQDDGSILFLCGSQYEETFTGNDGEIATLTIEVAGDVAAGDYPVILKNMKLSENDIRIYYETEYVESTITVTSTNGIETIRNDDAASRPTYNLSGQRLSAPQKGINIVGGRKVVMK